MKIGYSDFLRLLHVEGDSTKLGPNLAVYNEGVYIVPLPPDAPATTEERAILAEHPLGDLTKPALPFPCTLDQLRVFIEDQGLRGYIDAFELLDFAEKSGHVGVSQERWPWGSHETKSLRNLAAAAREFWSTYDPADKSTAPKNDDVSRWLQDEQRKERRETARMADAIASILRADDLPTGPRT
jgi:hypothetical protein